MKVIPKLQRGGGFDSFFTTYTPVLIQPPRLSSAQLGSSSGGKQSSEEKGKLTEKDFFLMLKDIDGLPNEMRAVVNNLTNTFQLNRLTGVDTSDLATMYLLNLYLIKVLTLNKTKYDLVLKNAQENGSLAEPAISMDGKLVVQDAKGGINTISLSLYFNNLDKYTPITVSQLANARAYMPSMVHNDEALNIINNSVGFESFLKALKEGLTSLGTDEVSKNSLYTLEGKAVKSLLILQEMTPEQRTAALSGVIEGTTVTKSLVQLAQYLKLYLTTIMPDRIKTWAAFKLRKSNKNEAVGDLIGLLLASTLSSSSSLKLDFEQFYNRNKDIVTLLKKETKEEKDSKEKATFLTGLQTGTGGRSEDRIFNLGGQANFHVTGEVYDGIADTNGNTIFNSTLSEVLSKSGIAGISNTGSIVFGNQVISPTLMDKIAISNSGGFRAVLPCVRLGTNIVPNFDLINAFTTIVDLVSNEIGEGATLELRLLLLEKKIAAKPELKELLTISGKLDESKLHPFFIVLGFASDQNIEFKDSTKNKYIKETKDKSDIEYFKTVTKAEDFDDDDNMVGDHWFWFNYDKVYKSDVFIPITTHNRLAAIIFSGQKIPDSRAMEIEQESQKWQMNLKVVSSANLLGI